MTAGALLFDGDEAPSGWTNSERDARLEAFTAIVVLVRMSFLTLVAGVYKIALGAVVTALICLVPIVCSYTQQMLTFWWCLSGFHRGLLPQCSLWLLQSEEGGGLPGLKKWVCFSFWKGLQVRMDEMKKV